jgi:hemolysin III
MYHGERLNSITHLLGAVFAVVATSILLTLAMLKGDAWRIVGFSIYGAMMIFLYTSSTIYHSIQGPWKSFWQKLDHLSIYLMIAGSYTPFMLIILQGVWGWTILTINWGLAFVGIFQEILVRKKSRRLSLVIYLLMGWLVVVAIQPLVERLPNPAMWWLVAGGLFYTGGVGVYVIDEKIKHGHGIWHLFVLAGTVCHFACLVGWVT